MSDRELLELAAKAAGIKLHPSAFFINGLTQEQGGGIRCWNPLTDDGDALRLAVALGMDTRRWTLPHAIHISAVADTASAMETLADERIADLDPYAATRRAIVRAAAAIGEQMP